MKKIKQLLLLFIFSLSGVNLYAQWVVHDPGALAQSILNYAQHCNTVANTLDEITETNKIFQQGKEYYESLRNVHHLIKDGRKVKDCVTISLNLVDEYSKTRRVISSDPYFTAYQIEVFNRQQSNLITAVANVISDMNNIVINTGMSLSDKERLDAIDSYYTRLSALSAKSYRLNQQMLGESESIKQRKEQKRLERELLR